MEDGMSHIMSQPLEALIKTDLRMINRPSTQQAHRKLNAWADSGPATSYAKKRK